MKVYFLSLIKSLETEICKWQDVSVHQHERGGYEFRLNTKEIGHIHWNGDLDILFNLKIKNILMEKNIVEQHKWVPNSGWTTFVVSDEQDLGKAIDLLKLSYLQKAKRYYPENYELYKSEVTILNLPPIPIT